MDERVLDRAIDVAAGTLMAREPSRALGRNVMARVCESSAPAPRRFVWVTAAAGVVLCAAIATLVMNDGPAPVVGLPQAMQLPIAQAAVMPGVPIDLPRDTPRASFVARQLALAPHDVSTIELIETQPIALTAIEVPPLERETTLLDTISIEPLTIEPLAASND